MAMDIANNPCCKKKGTLVITIEPCTQEKETVPDPREFYHPGRYVPGLPNKTPRTMEIEVKIKGKDQDLFSEEELSEALSIEERIEEQELINYIPEESVPMTRECSTRTISLERKPCAETCPGPLVCLSKKHFFGDSCKLHDPSYIGRQILSLHKTGLIQKRLYTSERIYPDHIMSALAEIRRRQTLIEVPAKESVEGDKGDVVPEVEEPPPEKQEIPQETKDRVQEKKNRSGCYC